MLSASFFDGSTLIQSSIVEFPGVHYSIAWDTAQNASSEQHNQTISNPTQAARSVFGAMKWSWNMRECLNLPQTTGSRDPVGVAHPSLRNKRTKERASERNQPTNKSTHPRTHSPSPCDYAPTHLRMHNPAPDGSWIAWSSKAFLCLRSCNCNCCCSGNCRCCSCCCCCCSACSCSCNTGPHF